MEAVACCFNVAERDFLSERKISEINAISTTKREVSLKSELRALRTWSLV